MNQKTREALENEAKYILELEENYIPLNIWSIKLLGLDAALMLAALYEDHLYQRSKGNSDHFKCSINMIKRRIGLSESRQRKAIQVLIKHGLIQNYLNRSVDEQGKVNRRSRMFKFDFNGWGYSSFIRDLKNAKATREHDDKPLKIDPNSLPF